MPTKKSAKKAAKTAPRKTSSISGKKSSGVSAAPARPTAKKSVARSSKPAKKPAAPAREITPTIPPPDIAPTSADLVDTQLAKYRSMRDFKITAEPAGDPASAPRATPRTPAPRTKANNGGLPFVIQKHAASHLHYDFRLGWSGVLKSWAVAKGPSYVVADRRLAVQVEDHPIEYGGFEGIIPKGQYGGGTVMVWDQGTWWPQPGHENVEAGLRTGSLKFELHGTKLRGKWTLVRMHSTKPYGGAEGRWKTNDKPQWLLIKEHDAFERPATAPAIVDEAPNSALTGRSMDQIAHESDHVWNSKETANTTGTAWFRQDSQANNSGAPIITAGEGSAAPSPSPAAGVPTETRTSQPAQAAAAALRIAPRPRPAVAPGPKPLPAGQLPAAVLDALEDLPREPQPEFIQPQLAQEAENPPEGPGWLHELKLDGYRMQARKSPRGVQMLTRSGLDWTYRVPSVAEAVAQLSVESATLDGEVVVLAEDGNTNFADLQASFQNNEKHPLTFFCFDLLHLEGRNTRNLPLRERKALLAGILPKLDETQDGIVRYSEHLDTNGRLMFEEACRFHAEGIISKRAEDPYQVGRRASWLKSKCLHEQEFVVGGFSLSSDGHDRIGSLLLGYYRDKKLIFAGRTGTGFTQKQRKELRAQLAPLQTKTPAFMAVPADQRRDALWVRPELVAQVRFATWTAEDLVRQAAFLGLREDKRPEEVVREEPTAAPQPKSNHRKQPDTSTSGASEPKSGTSVGEPKTSKAVPKAARAELVSAPATIRLTHPKKILDPESGVTKQQLADFYWAVADRMLPHIADRPLSLVRCPDGAGKPCFYQKHVNSMLPPGIGSVMVADKKGGPPEPYITLNTPEALTGLAQMGVLEIHPWGSRNNNLECPDRLIFDLDPDETLPWLTVTEAALDVRARLKKLGLESFLKTTGGKGLHIVAPIAPEHEFSAVKDFAHRFVVAMEGANPRLYLTKMTKAARVGKIYLDYLRNERGATAVAPFSPRARPGVNASVPLDWKELDTPERPAFPVGGFASWQDRLRRDPWKRMAALDQRLRLENLRIV
ncbi:MAG TPA: DNA ligase D [Acidobacteriaceae bacterium]|nr:DNA ligase D [Acidobacteriaceae bacterium]